MERTRVEIGVRDMALQWPERMPDLPVPDGEVQAVPGVVRILDNGVPWIRGHRELLEEWQPLDETAATLLTNGRQWADLDGAQQALAGMWVFARWTLGFVAEAPVTQKPRAVTGAAIRRELAMTEMCVASRAQGWEWATGGLTWLLWITGSTEDLVWPGWNATHAPVPRRPVA